MNENMKQKLIISPERILRKLEFRPNFDIYNLGRNISIISVENPFFILYTCIYFEPILNLPIKIENFVYFEFGFEDRIFQEYW